ncbi:glycoside hydrolase family 3 N-terminal domain-containing protein [Maribellus sp. YY47]|uniref:glycoside hydrolase family 3 N-terminal domain-containing protein n=1 Tax=Maribellus sp. YY47 TaxID=2929486 RepID=UPI0020011622|nr:glycoside hydrolase family 3 N-terminal domain-containing protein [Maribellus sp. YY47]MCK3683115.1 serine hydrolase [Maribellus sp. YY47]
MKKAFLFLFIFLASWGKSMAQFRMDEFIQNPWVDSVFQSLTPDQRIAQLVWVNTAANNDLAGQLKVTELIKKYNLGGVIFFTGDPEKQVDLTNIYQAAAQTPLFVAMDAEWGVGMRLPGVISFPYNMMMGASYNPELIKQTTREMALQMKRLGVQVSLGPVVDINTQPLNPIIGMRSFGESPEWVTQCGLAYMQGLQENNILAVAKHFPGHGDTQTDSHHTLPIVPYSIERLESVELYPFKKLTEKGIAGVMSAHLNVPELDDQEGIPSSLSSKILNGILRDKWNYDGLIITDAMNMAGAKSFGEPGEIEALALKAGNDVVEFPKDVEKAIAGIKNAVESGFLSQNEIDIKCKKVLAAKYWAGLNQIKPLSRTNLKQDLNNPQAELVKRKMIEASLTLLENKNELIPLQRLDTLKVACLAVGRTETTPFQSMLSKYTPTDNFFLPEQFTADELNEIKIKLKDYNLVVTGLHLYESKTRHSMQVGNMQKVRPQRPYGLTHETENLLDYLAKENRSIVVFFSSPYALAEVNNFTPSAGLIMAYQNDSLVQELSAQLICGGVGASGKLPVSIGNYYKIGDGLKIDGNVRMKYTIPEEVGMNGQRLNQKIDSIVSDAIHQKATPGCSVLAAKDGKIIFRKTYGYHTYDQRIPVSEDDLYDLASVTKVSGALAAVLKLTDEGKINLDNKFSANWPDWKKGLFHPSDKEEIGWREILAHQSGLIPYLNYWTETVKDGKLEDRWYSVQKTDDYPLEVAPGLFLKNKFKNRIYKDIRKSKLNPPGKYVYSGLSFLLIPQITENLSGQSYTEFLDNNFYRSLGASKITYNPLNKFSKDQIVPTEYDSYYRKRQIQGTVHDEAAAVFGGVAGNAGLFANANDLAKLIQMYMQMGSYGGMQYLSRETMEEFTRVQFPDNNNRRGLGFDKPLLNNNEISPAQSYPCPGASPESFGHSGFTGTFVWADPSHNLIYIFLSNRVYPTRESNMLGKLNVRTNILQVFYDEIGKRTPLH